MAANLGIRSVDVIVNGQTMGSACCVWKTTDKVYLLTAAHVLKNAGFVKWSGAFEEGWGTVVPASQWRPSRDPDVGLLGDLDAGLVEIDQPGPLANNAHYPWAQPFLSWNALNGVSQVVVMGKYNSAFARLVVKANAQTFHAPGHLYSRLLVLQYDSDSNTQGGDSGAAVVALPEMQLVGMHLGQVRTRNNSSMAVAVAAEDLIASYNTLLPGFSLRP